MSSIPSSAMPHAKVHHDEPELADSMMERAKSGTKNARTAAMDTTSKAKAVATDGAKAAIKKVKANPKTSAAIGVAVLAGAAAAAAGPIMRATKALKPKSAAPKAAPKPKTASKPRTAAKA